MNVNGSMGDAKLSGALVKRNVIIQKDEFGFGLTVSGDNPVYVQSVKDCSAAAKAGVQVGDRILKVNGELVTSSNHIEVVTLIKSGSYVALTLLGKDNSSKSPTESRSHLRSRSDLGFTTQNQHQQNQQHLPGIPSPDVIKNDRLVDVERMLNQERDYNKTILEKYKRTPSPKSQVKLAESKTRIAALEKQLQVLSGNIQPFKNLVGSPYRPQSQIIDQRERLPAEPVDQSAPLRSASLSSGSTYISLTSTKQNPPFTTTKQNNTLTTIKQNNTLTTTKQNQTLSTIKQNHTSPTTKQKHKTETFEEYQRSPPQPPRPVVSHHSSFSQQTISQQTTPIAGQPSNLASVSTPNLGQKRPRIESEIMFEGSKITPTAATITEEMPENKFDSMFVQARQDVAYNIFPEGDMIMSMEDGEFSDEDGQLNQHGPFERLELLRDKKAHLAVFLHYLISNSDPAPLLFWVVTENYMLETGPAKELKKWAYEIFSSFITQSAPLKVSVGGDEEKIIADLLSDDRTGENRLKIIFQVARSRLQNELEDMLKDFRLKRAIGLGGLFGDRQLEDNMDRQSELKIVETTLMPHLDTLMGDADSSSDIQTDKNFAMAGAIATLMKSAGLTPGKVSSGKGTSLERCRSFAEKEKNSILRPKRTTKVTHNGHLFIGVQYTNITSCNVCSGILWGMGTQGFQCQGCEVNVHRKTCLESIKGPCPNKGKIEKPKKERNRDRGRTTEIVYTKTSEDNKDVVDCNYLPSRPRVASMNEEITKGMIPGVYPNDPEEPGPDSEKDPDSRCGTPAEEQPAQKARTLGNRQKKVATKNVHRSNSEKNLRGDIRPIKPAKPTESGGMSPFGRVESPQSDSEEEFSDSDMDVKTEIPTWSAVADKKIIKKLKSKEIKRQEVIHELLHTEKTHVRNLKVLDKIFYKKIKRSNMLSDEELKSIFPNLDELIAIHESLLQAMKARERENEVIEYVGDIMLNRFDGEAGERAKEVCATFCKSQKNALEQWKVIIQNRKEFAQLINKQEESPYCRRLKFTAILASTHQRLVKYPMLLDSLNKSTPIFHPDYKKVEKCSKCCKDILNHVNNEVKRLQDEIRLKELYKKIDDKRSSTDDQDNEQNAEGTVVSTGKLTKFDIMKHSLVLEGDLIWRISATKKLDLHVVLLNDVLVLLQKEDEKYILKTHKTQVDNKGHSPIIKLTNALIREVATNKKAFFLVSTSFKGPQIYELVAQTNLEKKLWVDNITNGTELNIGQDVNKQGRRDGIHVPTAPSPILTPPNDEGEEGEKESSKEKDEKDAASSDEEDKPSSLSSISSPVLNLEPVKPPGPTPERMEELDAELTENEEDMKLLVSKRSSILSEIHGGDDSELLNSNVNQPRDLVVLAMNHAHLLKMELSKLCSDSATDAQTNVITQQMSGLQKNLNDLLNAVDINDKQVESYHKDSCDGGKETPPDLRRISKYNDDVIDNMSRHSPLDDSVSLQNVSPPPILVSDTSLDQDVNVEIIKSDSLDMSLPRSCDNSSDYKPEATLLSNEIINRQNETCLITSPFKIIRKNVSDTDINSKPQSPNRTNSFNMSHNSSDTD